MLSLELPDFMIELKEGAIKNVGPSNKEASVKLFDVERVRAREFGDKRVKLVFKDGDGNEMQVSLFPEEVDELEDHLDELRDESGIFE